MKSTSSLSKRALVGSTLAAAGLALASSTFTAAPAQAFGLSIAPNAQATNTTENTGATAFLDFDFVDTIQGVLLNLGIKNTTNGTAGLGATQATLVGVAFDLLDGVSISKYDSQGSGFTKLWSNAALNPFGTYDAAISPERNSFAGGNPKEGLTAGQNASVSFLLGGTTGNAAKVESDFFSAFKSGALKSAGRFQQVNAGGGSDKVGGEAVPEPTTIGGLILGGGMLAKKWRSRKQQQKG